MYEKRKYTKMQQQQSQPPSKPEILHTMQFSKKIEKQIHLKKGGRIFQ